MSTIRLMGQNQWNNTDNLPEWEKQGLDCSSAVRMRGHTKVISDIMPDILGGQEVNMRMQLDLKINCMAQNLPYTIIWGNMTPIIYRADKLELLDTEYLLYPVRVDGFEGTFNDAQSKSVNVGVFRTKDDGNVFVFATTHLWWKSSAAQPGSAEMRKYQMAMASDLIAKYQAKYGGCPAVLVGDMNAGYEAQAIRYALDEAGWKHAYDEAVEYRYEGKGFNGCGWYGPGVWQDEPFEKALDHILVRDMPVGAVRRFDRYCTDAYLALSDHAPVIVDLML
ncbi:MAG: endonuclease/exonuclease/phosphatase family protein [Clostridia bacterium]|nr:endonuclease/exonuclease/phosphatase family protein [Clostridia bacterium]